MSKKTAIIGNPDEVRGFALLGVEVVSAANPAEAREHLFAMRGDEQYAAIFVMEHLLEDLSPEDERRLAVSMLPAIVPLPSLGQSTEYGTRRMRRLVERAVGSDITIGE